MNSRGINVAEYLLAGKSPELVALRFPQSLHSYGALTTQAGLVAAHLLKIGGVRATESSSSVTIRFFGWPAT